METTTTLLEWQLTSWQMTGQRTWKRQPVILVEGQEPFYGSHPEDYMAKLQEMHDNPVLSKGPFYTLIGQLKDALEQSWG